MARFISFILFLFLTSYSWATTYYIRSDGSANCTGLADAAYGGAGTGQPCAKSHLYDLVRHRCDGNGTCFSGTTIISGGDTIIVGKSDGAGGSTDKFPVGYQSGVITPSGCGAGNVTCYVDTLPAGPNSSNMTKLVGRGYDTGCTGNKAQFWGTGGTDYVLYNIFTSNIQIECLDITDHSACVKFSTASGTTDGFPNSCVSASGPWGATGINARSISNGIIKNVDVHGMGLRGIMWDGNSGTWTFDNLKVISNGWSGIATHPNDSDNAGWSGTLNATNSYLDWNGCGERYPLVSTNLQSSSNRHDCASQGQGILADGWEQATGNMGTFNWTGGSISHNTQDGLDLLHSNATGTVNISRTRFEGNAGNQIKLNSATARIENSVIIGNCAFFQNSNGTGSQSFTQTTGASFSSNASVCRGGGAPIGIANSYDGQLFYIYGNTITGHGDGLIMSGVGPSSGCGSNTHIYARNNIAIGGHDIVSGNINGLSNYYYAAGPGACTSQRIDFDYEQIYGVREGSLNGIFSEGTHTNARYGDPMLSGEVTLKMTTAPYYQGTDGVSLVSLISSSPSRYAVTGANSADETLTFGSFGSNDYNNTSRGSNWDGGALQFGSTPSTAVCGNLSLEAGEQCDDGNQVNGDGCSSTCVIEPPISLPSLSTFKGSMSGGKLGITGGLLKIN